MCAQTTWSMNMTTPTSCCGESHRYRVVCIWAARHSKTLNSQLEAELSTFVQGNPCLMPLSSLLWVFMAIAFSGRDASKHECKCSGWKVCTQAVELHRDLGKRGGLEKSKSLRISIWFLGVWSEMSLIRTLFYSLLPLCFLVFFSHRIWCGPESYSRPVRCIQPSGAVSHPELSVWNKLECLLPLLVQATSQWTDDLRYSSGFRSDKCKERPLLCKL